MISYFGLLYETLVHKFFYQNEKTTKTLFDEFDYQDETTKKLLMRLPMDIIIHKIFPFMVFTLEYKKNELGISFRDTLSYFEYEDTLKYYGRIPVGKKTRKIYKIFNLELCIHNDYYFNGIRLPLNLTILEVINCTYFEGNELPKYLQKLFVRVCCSFKGNKLPKKLQILIVDGCYCFQGNNLPNLIKLNVTRCGKFKKKNLSKKLKNILTTVELDNIKLVDQSFIIHFGDREVLL